jgi:hypothetical protein
MPPNLADKLESFSGYKHVYSPQDPLSDQNPVRYAYLRPNISGRTVAVLSRLAAYGVDYSGRSNKIAHHIVLEPSERPSAGPAWLLNQSNFLKTTWDGTCKTLPTGPKIPSGDQAPGICQSWKQLTGDAGWGGQVATWLRESNKPIWLIYDTERQSQILNLITESLALLPAEERWKQTFATYFTGLPSDVDCRIRGVVTGSDEARLASARGHIIDLTKPKALTASSELIESARTGRVTITSALAMPDLPGENNSQNRDLVNRPISDLDQNQGIYDDKHGAALNYGEFVAESPLSPNDGDYNLSPPPMPTERKWKGVPTLPSIDNESPVNRIISLPFSIIILGGLAVLTTFLLASFILIPNLGFLRQLASSPTGNNSGVKKSMTGSVSKKAEQPKDSEVGKDKSTESSKSVLDEKNEPSEAEKIVKITLMKNGEELQTQTFRWGDPIIPLLNITVPENQKGNTGYSIRGESGSNLSFFFNNDIFGIEDDKIMLKCEQDYESLDDNKTLNTSLTIRPNTNSEKKIILPISVVVENEKKGLATENIQLRFDAAKGTQHKYNLRKHFDDKKKLLEVENLSFKIESEGAAVNPLPRIYGELSIDGDELTYSLRRESITKSLSHDLLEKEFCYSATFSSDISGSNISKGKVEIAITNSNRDIIKPHWDIASTVDGKSLILDNEKLDEIIDHGPYVFGFSNPEEHLLDTLVLTFQKYSKEVIKSDKGKNKLGNAGKIIIQPKSTQSSKIFDEGYIKNNLQNIYLSKEYFEVVFLEVSHQLEVTLNNELSSVELMSTGGTKEQKEKSNKIQILHNQQECLISFRNEKKSDIHNSLEKEINERKNITDLLRRNAGEYIDRLIKELGEIPQPLRDINFQEKLRSELLSRFEASKLFFLSTEFVIEPQEDYSARAKSPPK